MYRSLVIANPAETALDFGRGTGVILVQAERVVAAYYHLVKLVISAGDRRRPKAALIQLQRILILQAVLREEREICQIFQKIGIRCSQGDASELDVANTVDGLTGYYNEYLFYRYFIFNMSGVDGHSNPTMQDVNVRKAIALVKRSVVPSSDSAASTFIPIDSR